MFALDDAAQAFGGVLHGRRLGRWGHAAALSFYPTKTLGLLRRWRRAADRRCRPRRAVPQPAHAWRGQDALRGAAHRHERPARHHPGRDPAGQAAAARGRARGARRRRGAAYARAARRRGSACRASRRARSAPGASTPSCWPMRPQRGRGAGGDAGGRRARSGIYYPKPLHHQPAYAGAHAGCIAGGPAAAAGQRVALRTRPVAADAPLPRRGRGARASVEAVLSGL